MKKKYTTFTTAATKIVFITSTIDALKVQKVDTMDIASVFLHTLMDPKVSNFHMEVQGKLAEVMLKVDPKFYRKFVSTNIKGRMILYVGIPKNLYRILKSMLLFYLKLVGDPTRLGFELNMYDP